MSLPIAFEVLSETEKNNLLFLRGLRAELEKEVFSDLTWNVDDDAARRHLDKLILFTDPASGFQSMKKIFVDHDRFGCINQLMCLRAVCYRIARLEREACGIPLKGELKAA